MSTPINRKYPLFFNRINAIEKKLENLGEGGNTNLQADHILDCIDKYKSQDINTVMGDIIYPNKYYNIFPEMGIFGIMLSPHHALSTSGTLCKIDINVEDIIPTIGILSYNDERKQYCYIFAIDGEKTNFDVLLDEGIVKAVLWFDEDITQSDDYINCTMEVVTQNGITNNLNVSAKLTAIGDTYIPYNVIGTNMGIYGMQNIYSDVIIGDKIIVSDNKLEELYNYIEVSIPFDEFKQLITIVKDTINNKTVCCLVGDVPILMELTEDLIPLETILLPEDILNNLPETIQPITQMYINIANTYNEVDKNQIYEFIINVHCSNQVNCTILNPIKWNNNNIPDFSRSMYTISILDFVGCYTKVE